MAALLRGSESPATVVLGARRDASRRWVAHAWVEVAGQAWLDGGVTDFRRLATYAGDADWALVPSPDRLTS
jgi:transglutaminase-like putative cysteine protease